MVECVLKLRLLLGFNSSQRLPFNAWNLFNISSTWSMISFTTSGNDLKRVCIQLSVYAPVSPHNWSCSSKFRPGPLKSEKNYGVFADGFWNLGEVVSVLTGLQPCKYPTPMRSRQWGPKQEKPPSLGDFVIYWRWAKKERPQPKMIEAPSTEGAVLVSATPRIGKP